MTLILSGKKLAMPLVIFMTSCMSLGINFKHKTPKKAASIPEFSQKDSLIGFNNPLRSCFDVKHYDIHLGFNFKEKSIKGFVKTRFELLKETKKIQLDLDAGMQIDSIKQNQQLLSFTRKYTAVYIDLFSAEQVQELTVYYHGKPVEAPRPPWEGGFVWKKDAHKNHFVSVACEGAGAKTWLPVKTYLGDEPDSISIHLTVPKKLVAVSNGKLFSEKESGEEKTYSWTTSYSINPYNITFYIGDYKNFEVPYTCIDGEKMKLHYYVLTDNYEKAKLHFEQTGAILQVFEELFGKYPWVKDGYKLVESPFAGMEHQTAIAYGNGYKNERNEKFDYIILHESAHEWWGNSVSVADFSDVWIHEGFATYAEALYVEKTKGYQAYLNYLNFLQITILNKKPVIGPAGVYYWNYKDGDLYVKGAAILHSLRNQLNNDSLFFAILKTFYREFAYKTADTKDFISIVNKMTGTDLTYFFEQYLYRRESPLLKWSFDYDQSLGKDQLKFQLERVNKDFKVFLEVEQGGDKFYITAGAEPQYYSLPHPSSIPVKINSKFTYLQNGFKKK